MAVRVTREASEVLLVPSTNARVTREDAEVLYVPLPKVRVTREAVEVLYSPTVNARVTRVSAQILYTQLSIAPFVGGTTTDFDETDGGDDFDYDDLPSLVLIQGAPVLLAEPDELGAELDDYDYDADNSPLIVRRFIHAHLFVVR